MQPATLSELVAAEVRAEMARRNRRGIDLAEHLDISGAALSAKLNGRTPFTLNELQRVADWLDVPLVVLLGERAAS